MELDVTEEGKIQIQPVSSTVCVSFIIYPLFLRQGAPGRHPELYLFRWGNSVTGCDALLTVWEQNFLEMGEILIF